LEVLNPKQIRPPKRYRREVIFLTKEEIEAFIKTINLNNWSDFRFRVLVEVLLGTGMRIGEVLSLNRKSINWEKREAKIVGKGNKERTVFFTQRSLDWIVKFLEKRTDTHEAIFITREPINRLSTTDVWRFFKKHRELAKIYKKLTPHILRHTVATNLIFNGCPIVHVKEILGHERLDTTCKYYLGVDKEKAKQAHKQYLNFVN
jgi:integrase/recombinase XerD